MEYRIGISIERELRTSRHSLWGRRANSDLHTRTDLNPEALRVGR